MPCTTLLVGKDASLDGSTLMARNEDSPSGIFTAKKFIVVNPNEQPKIYKAKLTKLVIELPDNPMRYTAMPNASNEEGIWGEAGVNTANVAMSETETITSNARVMGADPLVKDGISEEDMLTIVLPYIHTAKEGVIRLGSLLEKYGTDEMNGIGFQDQDEIWWFESVGGHHWIAKRVPDNAYVVMPNQLGIEHFDLKDALNAKKEHMCSKDLLEFIEKYHLGDLSNLEDFDTRHAFGSHSDSDHVYNTPRAWYMARYFNPTTIKWDGELVDYTPESDNIPWSFIPEKKITPEDVKYILSSYYQGTIYNPYSKMGKEGERGKYRCIGINRNNFVAITQIRPYMPKEIAAIEWIAVGSNAFNECALMYANVKKTPDYLGATTLEVTTDSFYWANRIIGALTDSHYPTCIPFVDGYRARLSAANYKLLNETDKKYLENKPENVEAFLERANEKSAKTCKALTQELLNKVLKQASNEMKNSYSRSDN